MRAEEGFQGLGGFSQGGLRETPRRGGAEHRVFSLGTQGGQGADFSLRSRDPVHQRRLSPVRGRDAAFLGDGTPLRL